jgi:hypothetical protein
MLLNVVGVWKPMVLVLPTASSADEKAMVAELKQMSHQRTRRWYWSTEASQNDIGARNGGNQAKSHSQHSKQASHSGGRGMNDRGRGK